MRLFCYVQLDSQHRLSSFGAALKSRRGLVPPSEVGVGRSSTGILQYTGIALFPRPNTDYEGRFTGVSQSSEG